MTSFGGSLPWPGIYAGATIVGAAMGMLVALGVAPRIPRQLTAWMQSVDPGAATLAVVAGGAFIGCLLAAVAHLGVRWQLRRGARSDKE